MTTTTEYPAHTVTDKFTVWAHLDNHEPGREYFRGEIRVLEPDPGKDVRKTWVLQANESFMERIANGVVPIFLLDDGDTILPLYVGGWSSGFSQAFLFPFPVNPENNTRPDGRIIDYSTWALGPRTAYHLKVHD